jgi:hypothetical protein
MGLTVYSAMGRHREAKLDSYDYVRRRICWLVESTCEKLVIHVCAARRVLGHNGSYKKTVTLPTDYN